jgi:Flp pilus assembly protein TadD
VNRGSARQVSGDLDGALADFERAIHLAPALPEAWSNRAFLRAARGDRAGAVADYVEALRVAPPGWAGRANTEKALRQLRLP